MSVTHYRWTVVAIGALLGLTKVAFSADSASGDNIKSSTPAPIVRAGDEPRGLLAKKFKSSASSAATALSAPVSLPKDEPPSLSTNTSSLSASPLAASTLHAAEPDHWATMAGYSGGPSAAPLPPTYDTGPLTSAGDDCGACQACDDPLWCHRSGVFAD